MHAGFRRGVHHWHSLWPARGSVDHGEEVAVTGRRREWSDNVQVNPTEPALRCRIRPNTGFHMAADLRTLTGQARTDPRPNVPAHPVPHEAVGDETLS